jgi:hypothetical protein
MDDATRSQATRTAVVIIGSLFVFNVAFYFLSGLYFDDASIALSGVDVNSVRLAFGLMTISLSIATFVASLAPREVGHAIACLLGLASLVAGIAAFWRSLPGVLSWALIVVGVVLPPITVLSWRRVRAAWSFVVSICTVFGIVTLFGAPKVRGLLGISLWYSLIIPGLYFIAVASLTMVRADYRDDGAGVRSK